jgi:predicted nucleotide-binding protein (sugar kinase/HSP70/actin superfamily)
MTAITTHQEQIKESYLIDQTQIQQLWDYAQNKAKHEGLVVVQLTDYGCGLIEVLYERK